MFLPSVGAKPIVILDGGGGAIEARGRAHNGRCRGPTPGDGDLEDSSERWSGEVAAGVGDPSETVDFESATLT